jgi:endonuclease/exonuclease/phosphatase family metal-dependent hydrolase
MFKAIQNTCARSYVWTLVVLETGVEQKADVVCLQEPPSERAGIGISHSGYDIRNRKRVWTAVRKGRGLTTNERTDLSRNTGYDVIVVDITKRREKMIRIVNIYDQKARETGERPVRSLDWQKVIRQGGGGTVLAGDFNAHRQRWAPRCTERTEATYWEPITDEHRMVIGNDDRPTQYWKTNESKGGSIIDLTLANRSLRKCKILDGNDATQSDHEIIKWEVQMYMQEEGGGTQVIGWNLAAMSQDDKEHAEKLGRKRARGRAYQGMESTGVDDGNDTEWCQEALGKVLDASAKKIRICARSKSWWNGEIRERRSQLRRDKWRRRRSEATAQAKAELQQSIRRAKNRMWIVYLQNLRGAEVRRAAKLANP